jgi:hypothetical protein
MRAAIGIISNRTMVHLPWGTLGSFASGIEDGDARAVRYMEALFVPGEEWPQEWLK